MSQNVIMVHIITPCPNCGAEVRRTFVSDTQPLPRPCRKCGASLIVTGRVTASIKVDRKPLEVSGN